MFLGFAVAFAVKVPLFPVHTWLPDAHTEAPTAGSVILAGVMLKLGTYGLIRYGLYLFPEATVYFAPAMVTLGVIGIIYGAIVATMQKDLKRLVAYSSVAHLGFIVLGTFALTQQGIEGGVLQMVNHGLSTGALFLLVGFIYERRHTREIAKLKGLQKAAPIMAGVFTVVMLSSIGLPGLNGFVGEFLILIGSFLTRRWWTVVAATGVILAALYLLWAYQRVFHGEPDEENASFPEMKWTEGLVIAPLIALIVFLGVYPKPVLDRIQPSVEALIAHVEVKSCAAPTATATTSPTPHHGQGEALMLATVAQNGTDVALKIATPSVAWKALAPALILIGGAFLILGWAAMTRKGARSSLFAIATVVTAVVAMARRRPAVARGHRSAPGPVHRGQGRGRGRRLLGVLHVPHLHRGGARRAVGRRLPAPRGPRRRRAVRARAAVGVGRRDHGVGQRPDRHVPRARDPVDRRLRAGGDAPAAGAVARGRHEVLRARRVLVGVLPLRHRARLRLDGLDQPGPDRRVRAGPRHRQQRWPFTLLGDHPPALLLAGFGLLLVGFGFKIAAVPFHSWTPGRVRGLAHAGRGLHGVGGEGRRVRRGCCGCSS